MSTAIEIVDAFDREDTIPDDAWRWAEEIEGFRVQTLGGESAAVARSPDPILCMTCLGVVDENCSCA